MPDYLYWLFVIKVFRFFLCSTFESSVLFCSVCSINTVYYMAPFATMILAVPALLLEGSGVVVWLYTCPSLSSSLVIIFGSGVLAFCLNFSIFYVIHSTTAVTFNVAGNLKVSVSCLLSPHLSYIYRVFWRIQFLSFVHRLLLPWHVRGWSSATRSLWWTQLDAP